MEHLSFLKEYAKQNYVPILCDDSLNFLIDFIKKHNFENILEIGTAIGYSGSYMLLCSGAKLFTLEKDKQRYDMAQNTFKTLSLQDRVCSINCDAMDYLQSTKQKFDFIFLDGPKGQYVKYLPYLIDMLCIGGYIFADNVQFHGMLKQDAVVPKRKRTIVNNLKKFIMEVDKNKNIESAHYNIGDGITILKKIS